ncbi:diacylglycerol/lipid kinase family protein [Streptococcus catagoni]|uniref:diacylglycerol/lipid kinase family protein n=1 Tax=Streptococcus catagoni TaxID=2654874 RepID=UPI001409E5AE|nr:diacylglycerol kinase family protein [Streptococcus catagoni]
MTVYIIANPHAGNRQARTIVEKIKSYFTEEVVVFYTEKKDDEKRQVEKLQKVFVKSDQIMILSGDGTLSKVLYYLPVEIPVAYYPVGSGNDFANALNLPGLEDTINAMKSGTIKSFNCFKYDSGLMINSLDMGFPAYVVNKASKSKLKAFLNKIYLGKLTYIAMAIKSLFKTPLAQVSLEKENGQILHLDHLYLFSLANNTYFGGGITIWPDALAFHSNLDLVYAKDFSFYKRIVLLLSIVCKKHKLNSHLKHESLTKLSISFSENSLIEIDGEILNLEHITLNSERRFLYM